MDKDKISRRKFIEKSGKAILTTTSFSVLLSCSKKSSTEPEAKICLTVSGQTLTVHNVWKSGGSHSLDSQGLLSVNQTVSRNGETHTFEWSNINHDYGRNTVTSFDVKVDGVDYSYPADACDSSEFDDGY